MNIEKCQEILARLFVPRDKGLEGVCFRSEFMKDGNEAQPVYQAVSDAMRESGLSHEFSYQIANPAVNILAELEDWESEDMGEAVDSACPVYTSEIMGIYQSDSWAVDEAAEELGQAKDSEHAALQAWYMQIESMVAAIRQNLKGVIDEDTD